MGHAAQRIRDPELAALNGVPVNLALRTCTNCGSVLPDPTLHPPWQQMVPASAGRTP